MILNNKEHLGIKTTEIDILKVTELPIMDRYSTGSQISKKEIIDAFQIKEVSSKDELIEEVEIDNIPKKEQIDLSDIDSRLMTIDDFLN